MTPQQAHAAVKKAAKEFGRASPEYAAAMTKWADAVYKHMTKSL